MLTSERIELGHWCYHEIRKGSYDGTTLCQTSSYLNVKITSCYKSQYPLKCFYGLLLLILFGWPDDSWEIWSLCYLGFPTPPVYPYLPDLHLGEARWIPTFGFFGLSSLDVECWPLFLSPCPSFKFPSLKSPGFGKLVLLLRLNPFLFHLHTKFSWEPARSILVNFLLSVCHRHYIQFLCQPFSTSFSKNISSKVSYIYFHAS